MGGPAAHYSVLVSSTVPRYGQCFLLPVNGNASLPSAVSNAESNAYGRVTIKFHSPISAKRIALVHVPPPSRGGDRDSESKGSTCAPREVSVRGWDRDPTVKLFGPRKDELHAFNLGVHGLSFSNSAERYYFRDCVSDLIPFAHLDSGDELVLTAAAELPSYDASTGKDIPPIQAVTLTVLSNHGNDLFTCLYRVQVHGRRNG